MDGQTPGNLLQGGGLIFMINNAFVSFLFQKRKTANALDLSKLTCFLKVQFSVLMKKAHAAFTPSNKNSTTNHIRFNH